VRLPDGERSLRASFAVFMGAVASFPFVFI
jgi:hypothetical protein